MLLSIPFTGDVVSGLSGVMFALGSTPLYPVMVNRFCSVPKARVDRLGEALNKITQSPDIVEKFKNLGAIPRSLGPAEFGAHLRSEDARWSAIVKASGVRIE